VWLEGIGQLKNPMTSSGIEPATFEDCSIVPQPTTLQFVGDMGGGECRSTGLVFVSSI
jgi:hypothetical protein